MKESPYLPLNVAQRDGSEPPQVGNCLRVRRRIWRFLSLALAAVPLSFSATSTRIHSRRPGHL